MNVLFVGPYRQNDEWGRKSRSVLKAIQKTDHNVTSRPIYLSNSTYSDSYIEESEFNISNEYDILIQFLLQPYTGYNKSIAKKHIGIFNTETISNQIPLGQLRSELLMDEVWADSPTIGNSLQNILNSYESNTKVMATPPVLDVENLPEKINGSLREGDISLQNKFLFYYIGNILEEKEGFKETCLAYLNAFTHKDPVVLVIALENRIGDEQISSILDNCRNYIKKFKPYANQPHIRVVPPQQGAVLNKRERIAIHIDGDCMVYPSYTVSINSIMLEGALYKSTPIINKSNACYEWFGEENLWGIDSYEELCISENAYPLYRFTSGESWYKPIIKSLSETMKEAYVNKFKRDKKIKENSKLRKYFEEASYNNILDGKISW